MLYGSPRPSNRLMSFHADFSAPGSLRAAAVTHRTASLYRSAFCELTAFVASCSSRPLTASCSSRRVDRWLERFAEYVYEAQGGGSYQLVVRALQGVYQELSDHYRGRLCNIARALKGWRLLRPTESAPPLPRSWCDLLAFVIGAAGWPEAGVAILVAFDGYLRVGELLRLRVCDVLMPARAAEFGLALHAGLRLPRTKTGRNQLARIEDPVVAGYLATMVSRFPPHSRTALFPRMTADQLNRVLRWACTLLGLPSSFTMHSCRHGRAATAYVEGLDPESIRRAGRWASRGSLDTYLQEVSVLQYRLSAPEPLRPLLSHHKSLRAGLLL